MTIFSHNGGKNLYSKAIKNIIDKSAITIYNNIVV